MSKKSDKAYNALTKTERQAMLRARDPEDCKPPHNKHADKQGEAETETEEE